jgi:hypothetical protein
MNNDDHDDSRQLRQAARWLDEQADAIDAPTEAALARARASAGDARQRQWLHWQRWGGAGLGVALAASVTALLLLPLSSSEVHAPVSRDTALAATFAGMQPADAEHFGDIALAEDNEVALAEDMAFIAWLEETHDAG